MHAVTIAQVLAWNPCPPYDAGLVETLFAQRDTLTAKQISHLEIEPQDRLWALLHHEFLTDRDMETLALDTLLETMETCTPLDDGEVPAMPQPKSRLAHALAQHKHSPIELTTHWLNGWNAISQVLNDKRRACPPNSDGYAGYHAAESSALRTRNVPGPPAKLAYAAAWSYTFAACATESPTSTQLARRWHYFMTERLTATTVYIERQESQPAHE